MKTIVICRSDNQRKPYAIEKVCTSLKSVMEYFSKYQPDSTLVFGEFSTDNRQFVMPDDYYDSLEELIDSDLAENAELIFIFL